MDPIAHSLVGASLAATGLRRASRFGTATLLVGANLPDLDAVTYALGADASLLLRRGWTHGVLAMVALPFLLTGVMLLLDRAGPWRDRGGSHRARPGPLFVLALVSIWSHPALDLLNTYGVRLLMPLDGRWFYGDTLFIADPWFWLLAGAGAAVTYQGGWLRSAAWLALAALGTAFVSAAPTGSPGAIVAWLLALAAVAVVCAVPRMRRAAPRVAVTGLVALVAYVGAMRAGSVVAREQARAWLAARGVAPVSLMAGPLPVDPFRRDVIVGLPDRYEFLVLDVRTGEVSAGHLPVARDDRSPAVSEALDHPSARGFRTWMRFPSFAVTAETEGLRVLMRDVRYAREGNRGFAIAEVVLPPR